MVKKETGKGKKVKLTAPVISKSKKTKRTVELPEEMFGVKINKPLLAQAVHVYTNRKHQGTAATKSRGEVRGSTRKIYRQKGTGQARHGDIKAPIFVGGGVVHGPKKRGRKPVLSKKLRRRALFSALTSKFRDGKILFVDGLSNLPPRTKKLMKFFEDIGITEKLTGTFIVLPESKENVILAGRNIKGLSILPATLINAYQVLLARRIIISKEALPVLIKTFIGKKEKRRRNKLTNKD